MRVLLDECLPRGLARDLTGHEVQTVSQIGWSGVNDRGLLRRAAGSFDFLLTVDQRFASELPVPGTITLITLVAGSNRLASLRPLVPDILNALRAPRPGERIRIGA